jgi:hypothetical protein
MSGISSLGYNMLCIWILFASEETVWMCSSCFRQLKNVTPVDHVEDAELEWMLLALEASWFPTFLINGDRTQMKTHSCGRRVPV